MTGEPKLSWNCPMCERCWIRQEAEWDDNDRMISLRQPVRFVDPEFRLEQCAWCGAPTFVGIFRRADPATVPYPAAEDPIN